MMLHIKCIALHNTKLSRLAVAFRLCRERNKPNRVLTRTADDFVKSDLAFGSSSFVIVSSSRYFLIVLNTLIAASYNTTNQSLV